MNVVFEYLRRRYNTSMSCTEVKCKHLRCMLIIDWFNLVVFAVDSVVPRTVSQLFTCDVVTLFGTDVREF